MNINLFLDNLNKIYPEKIFILHGIEYTTDEITTYIKDINASIHTFCPNKFKKFLDEKKNFFSSASNVPSISLKKSTCTCVIGDLYFDTNTQTLKVFDGSQWLEVIHYSQSGDS